MACRDIELSGGGPWGFTLSGGKDFGAPLKVSKITVGGKAAKGGIRFGDYIIEINGDNTESLLHSDAMMLIKTTGTTLKLKVTKEVPRTADSASDGADDTSGERPRPPPVPVNPAPLPQKTTIVMPPKKPPSPEVKAQLSNIAPNSGLDTGGSSTQQSPAFKRITINPPVNRPSVFNRAAANAPPPSEQMRDIVIDDGDVRKTSQRPQPPSNSPSTVTKSVVKVPKGSPISKPQPPTTSGGTIQVGGQAASGGSKLSDRQGVCEACQEPIRGPFASAMGKVWHPEHFKCTSCEKSLQNTTFVLEEEKIYCEDCYQNIFAQTCYSCSKPILGQSISAVGHNWHQEHFTCSRCELDLSKGGQFSFENNQLLCPDCFSDLHGATCFGCSQRIRGEDLWVEALDHQWHPACFVCESCRRPLEGTTFFSRLGQPCCKDCA